MSHAIDRACRLAEEALGEAKPLVILTSQTEAVGVAHRVGALLPVGSTCTGTVWRTPSGQTVAIKRYTDPVPSYEKPFRLEVCNGGVSLTAMEVEHVLRWEAAQAKAVSVLRH